MSRETNIASLTRSIDPRMNGCGEALDWQWSVRERAAVGALLVPPGKAIQGVTKSKMFEAQLRKQVCTFIQVAT